MILKQEWNYFLAPKIKALYLLIVHYLLTRALEVLFSQFQDYSMMGY